MIFKAGEVFQFIKGNVGIGTSNPQSKLAVNGRITARSIRITRIGWPDYVFGEKYKLMSLESLENFIQKNKHLPGVPSQEEIESRGLDLGDMDAILLEKIEELTLHVINEKKELEKLRIKIQTLEDKNQKLEGLLKSNGYESK